MASFADLTPEEYQFVLSLPVMPAPPGFEAQLDQPPDYTNMLIVVVISGVLATISVLISVYTKLVIMKKPSWADLFTVIGWLLFVAYITSAGLITAHGGQTHMWNLRIRQLMDFLYYITFAEAIFGVCNIFLKVSILMQYRSIFATKARNFTWWTTYILMVVIVVFYVIITFCEIFTCNPRSKFWNVLDTTGSCMDTTAIQLAAGIFSAATDILILLIPQRSIWKLHLPLRRKLAISAVFLIGIIACVTSCVRTYYTFVLTWTTDTSYTISIMGYWTIGEICCGVLCASLPTMPRFIQHIGIKKHALSFKSSVQSMLRGKQDRSTSLNTETDAKPFASYGSSVKPSSNEKRGYADIDSEDLRAYYSSDTKS